MNIYDRSSFFSRIIDTTHHAEQTPRHPTETTVMSTFTNKTTTPMQRLIQVAERWRMSFADAKDLINIVDAAQSEPIPPLCRGGTDPVCTKTTDLCTVASVHVCTEATTPVYAKSTTLCTEVTDICTEATVPVYAESTVHVYSCKDLMQAKVAAALHSCNCTTDCISHDVGHNYSVFEA